MRESVSKLSGHKLLLFWALCLLVLGGGALSQRLLAAVPLFAAPLIYMVALRRWGLVAGLMAAFLTMLPSLVWGGSPVFVALGLAEVVFLHRRGQRRMLLPSAAVFSLAAFILIGIPLLRLHYRVSVPMAVLLLTPRLANNLTCATLTDLFLVNFRLAEDGRIIQPRRPMLLSRTIRLAIHAGLLGLLILQGFMFMDLVAETYHLRKDFGPFQLMQEGRLSFYSRTLNELLPLAMLTVLVAVAMALVRRDLKRNRLIWRDLLQGFGRRRLDMPPKERFAELHEPIERFVAANNAIIQSKQLEEEHSFALVALKQSLDLRITSDVRYFPLEGEFRFETLAPDGERARDSFKVHPRDRARVKRSLGQDIALEVRSAEREDQWHRIYARQKYADGAYARGLIFRLRQPRSAITIMRHFNRLNELGLATAVTAHELQQPMFSISLLAEQGAALAEEGPAATADLLGVFQRIKGDSERATRIIDRVARRARPEGEEEEEECLNMEEVVSDVIGDFRSQLSVAGTKVQVECKGGAAFTIRAPRVAMEQVVTNAMRNALDALAARRGQPGAPPGLIRIDMGLTDQEEFRLTLEDNGVGVGSAAVEHLFEAFYTTKAAGQGTGLGLFVCRDIVEEWGGRVSLTSAEPSGACWTLTLPATRIST